MILKSCSYCGRVHDKTFKCKDKKTIKKKYSSDAEKFRNTSAWQRKREAVRRRDFYMCQACLWQMSDIGMKIYNSDNIEVHHIVPIDEESALKLDDGNLICLCHRHHEEAEAGKIPRNILIAAARRIPPYTSDKFFRRLATPLGNCCE